MSSWSRLEGRKYGYMSRNWLEGLLNFKMATVVATLSIKDLSSYREDDMKGVVRISFELSQLLWNALLLP